MSRTQLSMDVIHDFQPRQIVCLEHQGTCLYAEVIQVVETRQICWVRPLLLGALSIDSFATDKSLPLTDLRSAADLLWPITLFRPALDTEVIPLLAILLASPPQPERNPAAGRQLNQFIHAVWQERIKHERSTLDQA